MENIISKNEFNKLEEKDVMFITIPGRMGDEDGTTFVIKNGDEFTVYRIDGWMYPTNDKENDISMKDASKQFPEWYKAWQHANDKDYKGKYKYIYMGFGNGLCVDNSIYNEYEPYLNKLVKEFLDNNKGNREALQYAAIFNVWQKALVEMIEKKYVIK